MTYKIDEIEGIGPVNAGKLSGAKIATTDDLLKLCCDSKELLLLVDLAHLGPGGRCRRRSALARPGILAAV